MESLSELPSTDHNNISPVPTHVKLASVKSGVDTVEGAVVMLAAASK